MREKSAVDIENAQLKKDLENQKNSCQKDLQRLSDQSDKCKLDLGNCSESSRTLQTQLISIRTESN